MKKNRALFAARAGMSLVEMMFAFAIFGIIMTAALNFVQQEMRAYSRGAEQLGVQQNLRYATETLRKDLLTVGSGVPANQPFLVYIDSTVIAFNANYASNDPGDPAAVYIDPLLPDEAVTALGFGNRITIPQTGVSYPDTTYRVGAANSPAETIIFFFAPDTTTARTDDYALYRQVNGNPPELVADNLFRTGTTRFFQYYEKIVPVNAAPYVRLIPGASVVLRHNAPFHQSPADTGAFAAIDRVRAVRVSFDGTTGRSGALAEQRRSISLLLDMPNAGTGTLKTCGDEPIMGAVGFNAVAAPGPIVTLTWTPATDENGGEKDVIRYVIWRGAAATGPWGDPYVSIPAGTLNYTYIDNKVVSGTTYYYALAAQDCTPTLSGVVVSAPVTPP